jgi:N-acetyl-anhydromuramyl-L-alanine amidase AmpD
MNLFYELFYKKYVESYLLPMPVSHWMIYNEALAFFPIVETISGFPYRSRRTKKIQAIILHHTGSLNFNKAITWFKNPNNYSSVHYLIDLDGHTLQLVPEDMAALHASDCILKHSRLVNEATLGLSLVGDGQSRFTEAQYEMIAMLCSHFKTKYNLKNEDILKHSELESTNEPHRDPTPFDKDKFLRLVDFFDKI